MPSAFDLIVDQIADLDARWGLGTFGAMAEFRRDPDEPADIAQSEQAISVVTPRGGMRLEARESLRAIAFETVTSRSWSQCVALCLPKEQAAMGQRTVLTELGPDTRPLRAQDRDAVLFDLGLGATQVDCLLSRYGEVEYVRLKRNVTKGVDRRSRAVFDRVAGRSLCAGVDLGRATPTQGVRRDFAESHRLVRGVWSRAGCR